MTGIRKQLVVGTVVFRGAQFPPFIDEGGRVGSVV
jgi:hypothetical protein